MNHSIYYVIGVICGVFAVLVFGFILRYFVKKGQKEEVKGYDERQVIARGKSYKTGLITFVSACLVYTLLETLNVHITETALSFLMILLLGTGAFVIDAIYRDAYFKVGESRNIWWFLVIAVINILLSVFLHREDLITEDGLLSIDSVNLLVGVWIIIIFINVYIKKIIDKKAEKKESEEEAE